MSASAIYLRLADLCSASAHKAIDAQIALGTASDSGTKLLRDRLSRQVLSLTETATELRAHALLVAINMTAADLARIDVVTTQAEKEIAQIARASALLTRIGQVLAVGLAIITLATQPGAASAAALVKAIETLAG